VKLCAQFAIDAIKYGDDGKVADFGPIAGVYLVDDEHAAGATGDGYWHAVTKPGLAHVQVDPHLVSVKQDEGKDML
jgi:hypothetical protein